MNDHLAHIRDAMPATTANVYLNTGTFGPIPRCVTEAIQQRLLTEWSNGRLGSEAFKGMFEIYKSARSAVTRLLHANEGEITLTDNTGEGINIVCYGFNWQPGDEIITTNHEHISGLAPLYQIQNRFGVTIRIADLGSHADYSITEAIAKLITPRTKLIALSHVTWTTGTVLDVSSVAALGHTHNIPVLVDGAQSAGNISINVKELGIDFYAIPMQKWLCGPDGTGALYISSTAMNYITPTYVGYFSQDHEDESEWRLHPTAQRFELGGRQTAALAGQAAVLHWLEHTVGYDWIYERISHLNKYAYEKLSALTGVIIFTPQPGACGLLSFKIEGANDAEIVQQLQQQHNILIRNIPPTGQLRISTGFYNTEEEIDRLADVLAQYAR